MSSIRFIRQFDEVYVATTKRIKRIARRRLKKYLANPSLPRALAFDQAAEDHQLAVWREENARRLVEGGS